jgi:hypothetical protein
VVNYSIVKFNGSTITGQADTVALAVANVNRMRCDQWYTEGRPFVAAYVGDDAGVVQLALAADGITYSDPRPAVKSGDYTTFGNLPIGTAFRLAITKNARLYRKHCANTAKLPGKLPVVVNPNRMVTVA